MRTIFSQKSYTECDRETIPRFFSKTLKFSISLDVQSVFILCPSWTLLKISKLSSRQLCHAFLKKKTKNRSGASPPTLYSSWFFKKIYFTLYYINSTNFIVWLHLLLGILGNICIVIPCLSGCVIIKCWIIIPFFSMTKKSRQQLKYLEIEKSFEKEIKGVFHYY